MNAQDVVRSNLQDKIVLHAIMDFHITMILLALAVVGMGLLAHMSPAESYAYQVSVLKRLRRALCGLLGLVFIGVALCLPLAFFGFLTPDEAARAMAVAAVLLGAMIIDIVVFRARRQGSAS